MKSRYLAMLFAAMSAPAIASNHTLEIRSGDTATAYSGDLWYIDQVGLIGHVAFNGDGESAEYPIYPSLGTPGMMPVGDWSAELYGPKGEWMSWEGCKLASIALTADGSNIRLTCPVGK